MSLVHPLAENTRMLVTESGVGVSLIAPGKVDTPFWDTRGGTPPGPALSAENIADDIMRVLGQPAGLDVNTVTIRPTGQVNQGPQRPRPLPSPVHQAACQAWEFVGARARKVANRA
jgi:NAD(P)-dependent dehydrogenase (short-subunit alcohol dehydrogenase family)